MQLMRRKSGHNAVARDVRGESSCICVAEIVVDCCLGGRISLETQLAETPPSCRHHGFADGSSLAAVVWRNVRCAIGPVDTDDLVK